MKKFFSKFVFFIYALVSIAFIGGILATIISPNSIWFFAFLGLAFPALFTVQILFLIVWGFRKKKKIIYPILFLGMAFLSMPNFFNYNPAQKKESAKDEIKVMSYNVRNFEVYDHKNGKKKRDSIIAFIKNAQPDIICFQEAFEGQKFIDFKQLGKTINLPHYHFEVGTVSAAGGKYGVAVFSKFPISSKESYQFGSGGNVGTKVNVTINGQPTSIFNIHLQSANIENSYYNYSSKEIEELSKKKFIYRAKRIKHQLRVAFKKKTEQVELMHQHIKATKNPIILCGDFNDIPSSYAYARVKGNLQDTFQKGAFGLGRTLPALPFLRIDHIFASNDFELLSHKIVRKKLSDHYPVISTIKLKK